MKNRPLFFICLILSGILMFITLCGEAYKNPLREDQNLEQYLPQDTEVIVTGSISKIIRKTNSNALYLKDVHITHKNLIISVSDFLVYQSLDNNFKTWQETAAKEEKAEVQDSDENNTRENDLYNSDDRNADKNMKVLNRVDSEDLIIGNLISCTGSILYFQPPRNPGNFDQKMYYKKQKIEGYLFAENVEILDPHVDVIKETLRRIRLRWSNMIATSMDEKQGNVLSAMLLGEKQGVDSELKELYQVNGIGHLLAVSGLHISLIGISLYQFFRRTTGSYPIGGLAGIIFMILYILMIGFSISAARAFLMFLFRVGADIAGRRYDVPTALSFAAFVLLLMNPLYIYDGGFWFSFGAIISIIAVLPVFTERYLSQTKKYDIKFLLMEKNRFSEEGREKLVNQIKRGIYESFFASLSIQIFLLPIQSHFYFEISPYSIFLNLIVIPLMSVVMISGIIGSFLTFFNLPGAMSAFGLSGKILQLYLWFCEKTLEIPGARIVTGQPKIWQVLAYYLGIGGLLAVYYGWIRKALERDEASQGNLQQNCRRDLSMSRKFLFILWREGRGTLDAGDKKRSLRKRRKKNGISGKKPKKGVLDYYSDEELSRDGIVVHRIQKKTVIVDEDQKKVGIEGKDQKRIGSQTMREADYGQVKNSLVSLMVFGKGKYILQLCVFVILVNLLFLRFDKDELRLTFLDVGQGDCIYIQSPDGLQMLVDGGSSSEKSVSRYRIEPYLEYSGVGILDYVFITHGDADHMNGISEMLDRRLTGVKINCLVLPPKTLWDDSLKELAQKAKECGTSVETIQQGQQLKGADFKLTCLYPYKEVTTEPGNETSLVLAVQSGSTDVLLTGDIEGKGEEDVTRILADEMCDVSWDILKVAHHGSKNSSSEEFLDAVKPKYAVISAGIKNRYGHPHEETLESLREHGCKVVSTQEKGAVSFEW